MKILHINPYPPDHLGGSEIFCKNLAINLKRYFNVDSDILTSDFFRKNLKSEPLELSEGKINIYYKRFLFNLVGKNPVVNIYKFLKKKYRNYDLIHIHSYIFLTSIQCAILKKFKDFPLVLHIHGGIETPYFSSLSFLEQLLLLFKEKVFDNYIGSIPIKNSDAVISVSKKDISILKIKYKRNQNLNFFIPNGIDTDKFQYKRDIERKYITFIGRLSYVKGFDIYLSIIKKLFNKNHNLKFLVIGEGSLKKALIRAKKELPITYFTSFPYQKMQEIYNSSKMLLITSRYEGLPTTLLESLSCKTPVISTDVGGISDVISNNKNGLLFNTQNYNEIIDEILYLAENEETLRRLGNEGRKQILNKYSWDKITDQIYNVYESVLESKIRNKEFKSN